MKNEQNKNPIITIDNVHLSFGDKVVLKDLSLEVYKGEILTIAGPSGSGKSTILKLITNLLAPDSGTIEVKASKFGMAFQYAALFNSLTVWENVSLALFETTNLSHSEIHTRVLEALRIVGLEYTIKMYPEELSGGMKKRISIARALALKPEILLYDEPSTGLDPATASKLEADMVTLKNEIDVTSIVVTHDIGTIKNVSDRVLILDSGKIMWGGTIKEFLTENSPYPWGFRNRKPIEAFEKEKK